MVYDEASRLWLPMHTALCAVYADIVLRMDKIFRNTVFSWEWPPKASGRNVSGQIWVVA